MTFGRMQVRPGMDVVGTGALPLGRVAEVHDEDFRVVREGRADIVVPYSAIRAMLGDQVVLDVHADEVDDKGWSRSSAESADAEYPCVLLRARDVIWLEARNLARYSVR